MDLHDEVPIASMALPPEDRLQRRLMARYYAQDRTAAKAPPPPPPGFIDDGEGSTVTGASGIPDGSGGGPGKRNIPKNHPYDPKALKPLSRMLWAMSVSLGHALAAYRQFTRLKSATISPDGMLGGRGYVMQVKEIRDKLHDACENLSSISDTIHDEIHAPHWEPQMAQLPPEEAVDVKKFLDESKQILNNPEEDAEDEMEAISDSAEDEVSPEGEVAEEGAEEGTESEGVEDPTLDEAEATPEDTAESEAEGDAQESEEAPYGEVPEEEAPAEGGPEGEEEPAPEDEEAPSDEGSDNPFDDQPDEETPAEETPDEEQAPEEEGTSVEDEEAPDEYKDEEAPPSENEDEVPTDPEAGHTDEPPDSDEEQDDLEDEGSDNPFDDQPDEETPAEETPDESDDASEDDEEDDSSPDDITEEDEAAADAALEGSGLPGAGEPPAKTLGNPKPKKKKKKQKFSPSPPTTETVQDQKFAPEMRMASRRRGNSSLPVDSLSGPRVNHLDRAESGRGPFDSYNEDEPRVTDDYGLSDGAKYDYPYTSPWENDTRHASVKMSADTHRTLKALVEKGWSEERILTSPMAKRLKLGKEHIDLANSSLPDDSETETEGWDLGLGWGARGQGAGGYENPSGEGNGTKGVFGPTSGLPSDPGGGGRKEDTNMLSTSIMPPDVDPPVARSDYFNEGLSDEMIATSEMPSPPSVQYNYDRDLPNKSEMLDQQDTPYIRYDYTTHNYRPDPVFSRPER